MRLYIPKKDRDALVGVMGSFRNVLNDKSSSAEEKQTAELQMTSISGALLSPLFPTGITRNVLMVGCFSLGFLAFLTPYEWLFWFFFIALAFSPRIFTGFRPDVRFLVGSTLTLVLGAMYFLGAVGRVAQGGNGTGLVVGPMMFLGALAYRSRKRRRLGLRRASVLRWSLEMLTLCSIVAAWLLQQNIKWLIATDPVPHLLIPLWIIAAYFCAGEFRRRRPKTG